MSRTPERELIVVTNTTPIIVAPAVRSEIEQGGKTRIGIQEFTAAEWIHTIALRDPRRADLLNDLDRGEAETIALAQELSADLVLIDERLGRRYANRAGMTIS